MDAAWTRYPAPVREMLDHPWVKVLLVATTIAMCTFALRETAWFTEPIANALREVLVPIAVGLAVAYVLTPIVDAIARQGGVRRFVAAGILFGVVSVALAVILGLVVPAVVREGVTLVQRIFQGQPPSDAEHGGIATGGPSQPWRKSLLASGLERLENWQNNLRVKAHLAFDRSELGFLDVVEARTAPMRSYQEAMISAARVREPSDQWPKAPPAVALAVSTTVPAPSTASSWPSPPQSVIEDAAVALPADTREKWLEDMQAADLAMAGIMARLVHALESARNGGSDSDAELIKEAWSSPASGARANAVQAFADGLVASEHAEEPGAHQIMVLLHGESPFGASALALMVEHIDKALRKSGDELGSWVQEGVSSLKGWFAFALDVVLVPIYAFFLILAMPRIRHSVRSYIPLRNRERTMRIIRDIEAVVAAFFRGRLIICTLCSMVAWLGFSMIGWFSSVSMPYAALFGLAIGFATTVPLSGILFLIPAIAMTMLQPGSTMLHAMLVLAVYVVVQAIEAVLIPLIMGREVELHPVMLIVALLLCGKLLGVLGLVLAVPIAASCRILAREFLWPRLFAWANRAQPVPVSDVPGSDGGMPGPPA